MSREGKEDGGGQRPTQHVYFIMMQTDVSTQLIALPLATCLVCSFI